MFSEETTHRFPHENPPNKRHQKITLPQKQRPRRTGALLVFSVIPAMEFAESCCAWLQSRPPSRLAPSISQHTRRRLG
eukprot:231176-Rhodomonas_salina.1